MPKPPARPKPAMRWGVFNKRGVLLLLEPTRRDAKWWIERGSDNYVRRVMVTPIASKGEK